jgi:hypothetical protein
MRTKGGYSADKGLEEPDDASDRAYHVETPQHPHDPHDPQCPQCLTPYPQGPPTYQMTWSGPIQGMNYPSQDIALILHVPKISTPARPYLLAISCGG